MIVDICTIQRDVLMTQKYIKELELNLKYWKQSDQELIGLKGMKKVNEKLGHGNWKFKTDKTEKFESVHFDT